MGHLVNHTFDWFKDAVDSPNTLVALQHYIGRNLIPNTEFHSIIKEVGGGEFYLMRTP